jgi:hypothetical protein
LPAFAKSFAAQKPLEDGSPAVSVTQEKFKDDLCFKVRWFRELRNISGIGKIMDGKTGMELKLTQEEMNGVLKKSNAHSVIEVFIDPEKNGAIRKMADYDTFSRSRKVLEKELKQDKSTGLWYPSHWIFEKYHNDQLILREENTLEVISLNKPIDSKRFTLQSVEGLKPGTPVTWKLDTPPPGKGKLEWDGKKIFAHGEFGENLISHELDAIKARKRWTFIVCFNITAIAAIIAFQLWRRKNKS